MAYDIFFTNDFTGGENTEAAPDQLAENQVLTAENCDLPLRGGLVKRKGCEVLDDTFPDVVLRLIPFSYINGTGDSVNDILALCLDKKLYSMQDPTTSVYNWGSWHIDYEVVGSKCYLIGNDDYVVWDGTTFASVTNAQPDSNLTIIKKCRLIEQRGQRIFVVGNETNPNSLYFSEVGDPTYFKAVSEILAVTDNGESISALKEFFGALVVFKPSAIYAWHGYDPTTDVTFQRLAATAGTRSYRTVKYVDGMLLYLSEDGIYALKGTYENVIVTEKMTPNSTGKFREIYSPADYTVAGEVLHVPSYMSPSHAVVYDGNYILSVVTGDTWMWGEATPPVTSDPDYPFKKHNAIYTLGLDALAIGVRQVRTYTNWYVNSWAIPDSTGELYGALDCRTGERTNIGVIRKHFVGYADEGLAYTMTLKTYAMHIGDPIRRKKFRYGYVWARQFEDIYGSDVMVNAYVDYLKVVSDVEIDESGVWDANDTAWDFSKFDFVNLVSRRVIVKKKGKRIIFEMVDNSVGQRLQIYGVGVEYKIKKPEKV